MVNAASYSGNSTTINVTCDVSSLDYNKKTSYNWKWKLNGKEIGENGKYNMTNHIDLPNECTQSTGWSSLRISNFTQQDLGQYKCTLLSTSTTVGEDEVNVNHGWRSGKNSLPPPMCHGLDSIYFLHPPQQTKFQFDLQTEGSIIQF